MSTVANFISTSRPDHPSLDFDRLRAEGIGHLEKLATEIWTDYNAHDPGITMLEALCYAITDLGYRTRMLPIDDLMANNGSGFKTWFEAIEILPNAPVTERDFRKLLIDVKGVKNAWLRKGKGELNIYWVAYFFPELTLLEDGEPTWDRAKIKAFIKANCDFDAETADFDAITDAIITYIEKLSANISSYYEIKPYLTKLTEQFGGLYNLMVFEVVTYLKGLDNSVINSKSNEQVNEIARSILDRLKNAAKAGDDYPLYLKEYLVPFETDFPLFRDYKFQIAKTFLEMHYAGAFVGTPTHTTIDDALVKVFLDLIERDIRYINDQDLKFHLKDPLKEFYRQYKNFDDFLKDQFSNYLITELGIKDNKVLNTVSEGFVFYYLAEDYISKALDVLGTYGNLQENVIVEFMAEHFPVKDQPIPVALFLSYLQNAEIIEDSKVQLGDCIEKIFCAYGKYRLSLNPDDTGLLPDKPELLPYHLLHLNGLYQIILDLDDDVDPANPKVVNAIVNSAMARLHANRGLCEDFLQPYVVEEWPIHLCLNLDLAPDADEYNVVAEVIWRLQEHLTPTLRFRTFAAMHDLGVPCDQIYNGPLLDNGFLHDAEVDAAQLLEEYNHSDLLRIILETPGVLGLRELKVNPSPEVESSVLAVETIYQVKPRINPLDFKERPNRVPPFYKRVIDICESCIFVNKGAKSYQLQACDLKEPLEWLRLTRQCEVCQEPGGPTYLPGIYRSDLSDITSIQYDLPGLYAVGDHPVLDTATPLRKAQARQLQAYLAFYDQILAAYLAQLGQISHLLAVEQDADAPTRMLPALYEVPGIRELIEEQAAVITEPNDWAQLIALSVPVIDRHAVLLKLKPLSSGTSDFEGFHALRAQLTTLLDPGFVQYVEPFVDYFWGKYIKDEQNNYITALQAAAETQAQRQQQRNGLLNHLLARFGETFSTYVAALLRPDAEPEDNPWRQDFDEYLRDKARFLRDIAVVGADRGKGYNYRKLDKSNGQPDVWNSWNVAGVKKRVSRLTGIDAYQGHSLIAEPPYRLDIVQSQSKQGTPQFRIVLKKRPGAGNADNPEGSGILLFSQRYTSKKSAQEKINELYLNIWKTALYEAGPSEKNSDDWVVTFTLSDNTLSSEPMGEEEAKGQLLIIQELVKPGTADVEGFHILEHILVRPNEPKDLLLQLSFGCDPAEIPYDPYSFWITVVLPGWTQRFKHQDFRNFFEHTFRSETPAHIAIRFCWLDFDSMYKFEDLFKKWMYEKARCTPSECHVSDAANALITLLNGMQCSCHCIMDPDDNKCDDCGEKVVPILRPNPVPRPNPAPRPTPTPEPDIKPKSDPVAEAKPTTGRDAKAPAGTSRQIKTKPSQAKKT